MKVYRTTADLPPLRRAKARAGSLLRGLFPRLSRSVHAAPYDPAWDWRGRLIRNAHLHDAIRDRDHATLQRYLHHFWAAGESAGFFDRFTHRFEELFLRHHLGIVEALGRLAPVFAGRSPRLVEIGSGDGRVLDYLARQLPWVAEFHGIDLNAAQVAACRQRHAHDPRLHFHCEDALDWLRRQPEAPTILFANGGVLEYLRRGQVSALLSDLLDRGSPAVAALTESLAVDHDLAADPASHPYGLELAFSHAYPAIAAEVGFTPHLIADRFTRPGEENHPNRWLQVLALGPEIPRDTLTPRERSAAPPASSPPAHDLLTCAVSLFGTLLL